MKNITEETSSGGRAVTVFVKRKTSKLKQK
jgi:hypothetical protein